MKHQRTDKHPTARRAWLLLLALVSVFAAAAALALPASAADAQLPLFQAPALQAEEPAGDVPVLTDMKLAADTAGAGLYQVTPAFSSDERTYTAVIPDTLTAFCFYGTTTDPNTIKLRYPYATGTYSVATASSGVWKSVSLNLAKSSVGKAVSVYVGTGTTSTMTSTDTLYTVDVVRKLSLSGLVSDETQQPAFDAGVLDYTASLPKDATTVDIKATGQAAGYGITINGTAATSGTATTIPVSWDAQNKMVVPVVVSADADNAVPTTYTLTFTREMGGDTPAFSIQPKPATYLDTATQTTPLKVRAYAAGDISYQWYRNDADSTTGGTLVDGATAASYTPPIGGQVSATTTTYYYCVATHGASSAASTTAAVTINPDPTPFDLAVTDVDGGALPAQGFTYTVGDTATPMKVTAATRGTGGTWSYQWMYRSGSVGGSAQGTRNLQTYTPLTTVDSQRTFYCRVTYTVGGVAYMTASPDSPPVRVSATGVPTPTISTQPVGGGTYLVKAKGIPALSIAASNNGSGTLSYQWYLSTDGETYDPIESATSNSIQPVGLQAAGEVHYRCVVTNTLNSISGQVYTAQATSDVATLAFVGIDTLDAGWDGAGTEADPFRIEDTDDLVKLRDLVNQGYAFSGFHFAMTSDLTLPDAWEPIGSAPGGSPNSSSVGKFMRPFSGVFDGGGNTLTVPAGGLPLFGYVREATIGNLKLYGEQIAGPGLVNSYVVDYGPDGSSGGVDQPAFTVEIDGVTIKSGTQTLDSGLIGGNGSGINYIYVKDCVVETGVTIGYTHDKSGVGSLVGSLNGTVEDCMSHADVYGAKNVGGLVGGKGQSMGPCAIWDSSFSGTVTAAGTFAGGILGAGYVSASAPNTPCSSVRNCYVTGTVTGSDSVGGIFGGEPASVQCWANGIGWVTNNAFSGQVVATGEGSQNIGGVIGYMNSLDRYNYVAGNVFVSGCGVDKGIGGVGAVDTTTDRYRRIDDPTGADKDKLTKAYSPAQFTDGTVVGVLNDGLTTSGDWVQGASGPVFGGQKHPVSLVVGGYKGYSPGYPGGSELNVDEISATLTYSDGTTETIPGSQLAFTGFDSYTMSAQAVIARYGKLIDMFETRVTTQVVDFRALAAAITAAEGKQESDYSPASWSALQTALSAARTVAADAGATQQAVNTAASDLKAALDALMPKPGEPVDAVITVQKDATGFVLAKEKATVAADLSERYGYADAYRGSEATALDALVAAHIALYGADEAVVRGSLAVSGSGFVTRVLGLDTSSLVFLVNGRMPGDGVFMPDAYMGGNSQTGYAIGQAPLSDDDAVSFVVLQSDYYMDQYSWFEAGGQKTDAISVPAGQNLRLTLKGYWAVFYGLSDAETQAAHTGPIEEAAIVPVTMNGAAGTFGAALATTDEDGQATLKFDSPGTYIVSAAGDSEYGDPLISPWLVVTVTNPDDLAITAAKATVEAATYAATQAEAPDEAAAQAKAESVIAALDLGGVSATPVKVSFAAPVAGSEASPAGTDGAYAFTVRLTKGGGEAQLTRELTLTVTATPYDAAAANAAAVAAAKAALPAELSCAQAEANAPAAVKAWTEARLAALGIPGGVSLSVEIGGFTAAVTGSAADNDGADGSFTATVTLSKGEGETLATGSATIAGVITATPYDAAAAVAAAKAALPASLTCQQKAANTEAAVKAWTEAELAELDLPDGVGLEVAVTGFTAASSGIAADQDGTNGAFTATVTLTKGEGDAKATGSAIIAGTITATAYEPPPPSVKVTISVEQFTVNGTYVVLPTKMTVPGGTSAAQATTTLLGAGNYRSTGSGSSFYLCGVKVAGYGDDDFLDEFDEGSLSGWKITVDNTFISTSAGAHTLGEGDVVRWQYTKTGDFPGSRDLGGDAQPADKDALTAKIAEIRDAVTESFYGSSYEAALAALAKLPATQAEIDAALAELTSHDPSADDLAISAAKAAVEAATYAATQAEAPDEAAAQAKVQSLLGALDLGGVGAAPAKVSYAAPVAGSEESPTGTDGAYAFTVRLTRGGGEAQQTRELTLAITATPYEVPEKAELAGATVALALDGDGTLVWTGRQLRPAVTAVTIGEQAYEQGTDYTVTYGANTSVGPATVTLTASADGRLSGERTLAFGIVPKATSVSSLTAGKQRLTVRFREVAKQMKLSRYQVRYRAQGSSAWKVRTVTSGYNDKQTVATSTLTHLQRGKRYQVTVLAGKQVAGEWYWSQAAKVRTSARVK
jgi:hypothetical protein